MFIYHMVFVCFVFLLNATVLMRSVSEPVGQMLVAQYLFYFLAYCLLRKKRRLGGGVFLVLIAYQLFGNSVYIYNKWPDFSAISLMRYAFVVYCVLVFPKFLLTIRRSMKSNS